KLRPKAVVIGGPGFTKEKFVSYVKLKDSELGEKIREGDASSSTFSGILEMLRRGEADKVLKELELTKDIMSVDEIFNLLAKGSGLVTYGLKDVIEAVDHGAAELVLISSSLLFDPDTRDDVSYLLKGCERTRAEFRIVDSGSEPGERLEGIGGVAAKLRYRVHS
ncbi:MAG: hypothetical protein NZ992_07485, partial [Candidatus Korarchaeum sp.]|nr:hypothetical protein [Candidatus Korarchaeum sp.]MDW8035985.1 hypothetical protein [Candidatus Korarchaeum sp.]